MVWPCGEAGERVPVEKMEREVVEMYAQDRKARAQEVLLPFRRLCGRRSVSTLLKCHFLRVILLPSCFDRSIGASNSSVQVETVVLEGDSVAEALVRYTVESGVRNLVLGSASLSWLRGYEFLKFFHPVC